LPIAHSAGFSPHPKISYAGGAPTGVASEAEYLSLALTSQSDVATVRERLNAALPDGIEVIEVTEDASGLPASRLTASEWQVILPGVPSQAVASAVRDFLALEHAPVERLTNKGMRHMDARSAVVSIDVAAIDVAPVDGAGAGASAEEGTGAGIGARAEEGTSAEAAAEDPAGEAGSTAMRMIVKHTVPAVRPDDVLTALGALSGFSGVAPTVLTHMTRLAQGSISESGVVMP